MHLREENKTTLLTYIKNSLKEIKTHTMFMNIFKAYDNNIVSI